LNIILRRQTNAKVLKVLFLKTPAADFSEVRIMLMSTPHEQFRLDSG
jgi:hypothetical protein